MRVRHIPTSQQLYCRWVDRCCVHTLAGREMTHRIACVWVECDRFAPPIFDHDGRGILCGYNIILNKFFVWRPIARYLLIHFFYLPHRKWIYYVCTNINVFAPTDSIKWQKIMTILFLIIYYPRKHKTWK
jgi:hypothetical protein